MDARISSFVECVGMGMPYPSTWSALRADVRHKLCRQHRRFGMDQRRLARQLSIGKCRRGFFVVHRRISGRKFESMRANGFDFCAAGISCHPWHQHVTDRDVRLKFRASGAMVICWWRRRIPGVGRSILAKYFYPRSGFALDFNGFAGWGCRALGLVGRRFIRKRDEPIP